MKTAYVIDGVILLALFSLAFLAPEINVTDNLDVLVSATSAVFAIVAGFFIADAMSNYLRLQTLIAEENASLITLAHDAVLVNNEKKDAVHNAIDTYMIAQLDHGELNHILATSNEIDAIESAVEALGTARNAHAEEVYSHMLSAIEKIHACRQEIALAAKRNLTISHWATLGILGVLVIISVLGIRDSTLLMTIFAGTMIAGTYAVLILLREVDNNHLLENKLAFENPNEVFRALGRPPYYPEYAAKRFRVPDQNGNLRLPSSVSPN